MGDYDSWMSDEELRREWRREFEDIGPDGVEQNLRLPVEGWWGNKGAEAKRYLREKRAEQAKDRLIDVQRDESLDIQRRGLRWLILGIVVTVLIALAGWAGWLFTRGG